MARIDLSETNGWVPEEEGSTALTVVQSLSAVEALARKESMVSRTKTVPRYLGDAVGVVAEGGSIPESASTLDEVVLTARKFANLFRISEEDLNDGIVNVLNTFKDGWANSYARTIDNAVLGTTAVGNGGTVPFNSVYYTVSQAADATDRIVETAGSLKFEQLSTALGMLETGSYHNPADLVVIAHPAFAAELRSLKDSAGTRVVTEPLNGTPGSIFGYKLVYSAGARTNATASNAPTGNPLIVMGNRQHLILGVRSGIESQVSTDALFTTDERYLKIRARRGFAVGRAEAFSIVEKTASA